MSESKLSIAAAWVAAQLESGKIELTDIPAGEYVTFRSKSDNLITPNGDICDFGERFRVRAEHVAVAKEPAPKAAPKAEPAPAPKEEPAEEPKQEEAPAEEAPAEEPKKPAPKKRAARKPAAKKAAE